jgi:hypothetical protein
MKGFSYYFDDDNKLSRTIDAAPIRHRYGALRNGTLTK